jgi:hypothetical protein
MGLMFTFLEPMDVWNRSIVNVRKTVNQANTLTFIMQHSSYISVCYRNSMEIGNHGRFVVQWSVHSGNDYGKSK